jgi:hypothetical protein
MRKIYGSYKICIYICVCVCVCEEQFSPLEPYTVFNTDLAVKA